MFRFVANLKPSTFDPARPRAKHPSYLLSIDYYAEHRTSAEAVVQGGRILVADNGNFDRLRPFAQELAADADALAVACMRGTCTEISSLIEPRGQAARELRADSFTHVATCTRQGGP
jgi:hypothetical protein